MIPWNKLKWEDNNPIYVGQKESNQKREIHSIIGLSQETRSGSYKQSKLYLKEL